MHFKHNKNNTAHIVFFYFEENDSEHCLYFFHIKNYILVSKLLSMSLLTLMF